MQNVLIPAKMTLEEARTIPMEIQVYTPKGTTETKYLLTINGVKSPLMLVGSLKQETALVVTNVSCFETSPDQWKRTIRCRMNNKHEALVLRILQDRAKELAQDLRHPDCTSWFRWVVTSTEMERAKLEKDRKFKEAKELPDKDDPQQETYYYSPKGQISALVTEANLQAFQESRPQERSKFYSAVYKSKQGETLVPEQDFFPVNPSDKDAKAPLAGCLTACITKITSYFESGKTYGFGIFNNENWFKRPAASAQITIRDIMSAGLIDMDDDEDDADVAADQHLPGETGVAPSQLSGEHEDSAAAASAPLKRKLVLVTDGEDDVDTDEKTEHVQVRLSAPSPLPAPVASVEVAGGTDTEEEPEPVKPRKKTKRSKREE